MKITVNQLRRIIKEEVLKEMNYDSDYPDDRPDTGVINPDNMSPDKTELSGILNQLDSFFQDGKGPDDLEDVISALTNIFDKMK